MTGETQCDCAKCQYARDLFDLTADAFEDGMSLEDAAAGVNALMASFTAAAISAVGAGLPESLMNPIGAALGLTPEQTDAATQDIIALKKARMH